jgi:DNA-binding NtrC family response regulator
MHDRERVLILESDEDLRNQLEWSLAEAGFAPTTTEEFGEAVDLLYSRDFDLVLVGEYPRMQCATELLRLMRQMQCPVRRIALLPETAAEARNIPRLGLWPVPEEPWCADILKIVGRHFTKHAASAAA